MDQELFNPQSSSVSSSRIIYTPSTFVQNLQRDLRNDGQQLSDLEKNHQSKAATPIYGHDCG